MPVGAVHRRSEDTPGRRLAVRPWLVALLLLSTIAGCSLPILAPALLLARGDGAGAGRVLTERLDRLADHRLHTATALATLVDAHLAAGGDDAVGAVDAAATTSARLTALAEGGTREDRVAGLAAVARGRVALAAGALTDAATELEGAVGTTGVPSTVRAAVAFYPPTNFLEMDRWMVRPCAAANFCHDAADSPESQLIGCAIQDCPDKARAADPVQYISAADPPIMILHGGSDPLVPHNQGERFYMALNKACHGATFISLPTAGHGPWNAFLTNDETRAAATRRSTAADGCTVANPAPFTPAWQTVIEFLNRHVK